MIVTLRKSVSCENKSERLCPFVQLHPTVNDRIQSDGCTCEGTFDACATKGGDSDGDGVCDANDCAPNDRNFPKPVGTACNDGNASTVNDRIQSDGCTCKGECFDFDLTCEYRLQKEVAWTSGNCNPTICSGGRLALSVSPNNYASYQWEGPNGFSDRGNSDGDIFISKRLLPEQAGTYSVTVTDGNGCTATTSISINTKDCPCTLNTEIRDKIYQENNSNNPDDHTFSFKTIINGSGENGWLLYDMIDGNLNHIIHSGNNNTTLDFGPIPVDGNGMLMVIMDADNTKCMQSVGVNMSSCVFTGTCSCSSSKALNQSSDKKEK